jgi:hypothetical protein
MLSSFTTRFHNLIWFLIFTFTLYCMPHLELLFPYQFRFFFTQAEASEAQQETPVQNQPQESAQPVEPTPPPPRYGSGEGWTFLS